MGGVVASIVSAVATAFVPIPPIGMIGFGTFLAISAGKLAIGLGISFAVSSLFGKPKSPTAGGFDGGAVAPQERTELIQSSISAQRLAYGEIKVSGTLIFAESTGTNKEFLHLVVALAAHEVQAINSVFLNEDEIKNSDLDGSGNVTAGTYNGKVRIKKHLGTDNQTADADLVSDVTAWTTSHKLQGIAYIYLRLEYDQDVFPRGIPKPSAIVRGKKIYDPRDAGTRWSPNPALILRDYLTEFRGLNVLASELDDTAFNAATNACEEFVTVTESSDTFTADASTDVCTRTDSDLILKTGDRVWVSTTNTLPAGLSASTNYYYIKTAALTFSLATTYANALVGTAIDITDAGTGTHTVTWKAQVRYEGHGVMSLDIAPIRIVEDLLTSMAGALIFTQGKFTPYAGANTTFSHSIDASWLRDTFNVRPRISRQELFNAVRGTFADPGRFYQPTDFPPVTNVIYETQDSGITDTFTADASTDIITLTGDGNWFITGEKCVLQTTGTLPAGLALLTGYFIIKTTATTLQLATTLDLALAGTAIDITGTGTGTHTILKAEQLVRDIELPWTADPTMAQRIAKIHLEKSRQGIVVELPCNLKALPVAVWDVVQLTISELGWTAKEFRVLESTMTEGFGIDLLLQEHSSASYDWAAGNATLFDPAPDTTLTQAITVVAPTGLTLTSGSAVLFLKDDGTVVSRIKAAWTDSLDVFVTQYEVEFKKSADANWESAGTVATGRQQAFIWDVQDSVAYDVRIRAVNRLDVRSSYVTSSNHTVVGKTAAPENVTGFSVQQNGLVATFKWNQVGDLDLAGYEIRYAALGLFSWDSATPISKVTRGTLVTNAALPPGSWTVGIRAVDTSGNYSAASTTADIVISNSNDVVLTKTDSPRWPGQCVGLYLHGVSRRLLPQSRTLASSMTDAQLWDSMVTNPTSDSYYEATEADLGFDATTVRVWSQRAGALGPGESGVPVVDFQIDYRSSTSSYDGFEAWPTAATADFRYLKGRADLNNDSAGAYLYDFSVVMDVEERTASAINVTVNSGGSTITFSSQFHATPNIQTTPVGSIPMFPLISSATALGFVVNTFSSSGTDIGGLINYTAIGA